MKIKIFLLALASFVISITTCFAQGHEIKIKIHGLRDSVCFLGNHFGDKQYIQDTVRVQANGTCVFKGKSALPGGIYLFILQSHNYFELIVNEQKFSIETDTIDFYENMKITGSDENSVFRDYQVFIKNREKIFLSLKGRRENNKNNKDSLMVIDTLLAQNDSEIKNYRLKIVSDHPKFFFSKVIETMSEPDIPEIPTLPNGAKDSTFAFRWFRNHYFDKVDFTDARLLRTPILQTKIRYYLDKLTAQDPDSIIISVDTIINKSKPDKEVFKYCVATLTYLYENSNVMGFDKVFVHIAENYYLTPLAYWTDSTLRAKIQDRVNKLKPNLIGAIAHDLVFPDSTFLLHSLSDECKKARYTILVFWDPTCGHCKITIPKLKELYDSVKVNNINCFAVGIESDVPEWKKYIIEHKHDWLSVFDMYGNTRFRDYYDIYSKPVIFILDTSRKIVGKRMDVESMGNFFKHLLKDKK